MRFVAGLVAAASLGALPAAGLGQSGGPGESAAGTARRLPAHQIKAAVEDHIQAKIQADGGTYLLVDGHTGETLRLEFVQLSIVSDSGLWSVHDADRVIEGPAFLACALFHAQGSPEKKLYDIDFLLEPRGATLEVSDVRIHKVPRLVDGKWIREARVSREVPAARKP